MGERSLQACSLKAHTRAAGTWTAGISSLGTYDTRDAYYLHNVLLCRMFYLHGEH